MEKDMKSNGALLGSIIIIIILIIGGIYIWQSKVQKALEEKNLQSENNISMEANALDALEQDINGVDTSVEVDSVN